VPRASQRLLSTLPSCPHRHARAGAKSGRAEAAEPDKADAAAYSEAAAGGKGARGKKRARAAAAAAAEPVAEPELIAAEPAPAAQAPAAAELDAVTRGKLTQMVTGKGGGGAAITLAEVSGDAVMGLAAAHWGVGAPADAPFQPALVQRLYDAELGGRRRPVLRRVMLLEVMGQQLGLRGRD